MQDIRERPGAALSGVGAEQCGALQEKVPMRVIIGAPGSGKTQRLVDEIRDRLAEGVSPYMILATTFSRQAAREIAERLDDEVMVRTIHGLAYWLIRLARRARGEKVPKVISEDQALSTLERAAEEVGVPFFDPRQTLREMEILRARGRAFHKLHPEVLRAIHRYFRILQEENLIDFTGLLEVCRSELEDPELRSFLGGMHVFVDEGQDLNPAIEWPILEALRRGAEEFVLFASPSQSIYGFRGADWEQLMNRFPEEVEMQWMLDNRRSTPEIVNAARPLAGPDAKGMRPMRKTLGVPVIGMSAQTPDLEQDYVGRQIAQWTEGLNGAGMGLADIAVLTRTHAHQNTLQITLRARGIPYHVLGKEEDLFRRDETQALLGYLRLAYDPRDDSVLETIINYPPCGIGGRTRFMIRGNERMGSDHLVRALAQPHRHRPQVIDRISQIIDLQARFVEMKSSPIPVVEYVRRILQLSGIPGYLSGEGDFKTFGALEVLASQSVEFDTLGGFVDYLGQEVRKPRNVRGVNLSTIHSAKGREWKAVIIPGFQHGLLPLEGADAGEERNLAFVGMTRARDWLVLASSQSSPVSPLMEGMPLSWSEWP